jgi:hypothetical protein
MKRRSFWDGSSPAGTKIFDSGHCCLHTPSGLRQSGKPRNQANASPRHQSRRPQAQNVLRRHLRQTQRSGHDFQPRDTAPPDQIGQRTCRTVGLVLSQWQKEPNHRNLPGPCEHRLSRKGTSCECISLGITAELRPLSGDIPGIEVTRKRE